MRQTTSGVRTKGEPAKEKAETAKDESSASLSSAPPVAAHSWIRRVDSTSTIHAVEGAAITPTDVVVCCSPFRISSRSQGEDLAGLVQRHIVLGLDLQGGS